MNTEAWFEENNRYLSASVQWLRLRLRRLVPEETAPTASVAVPDATRPQLENQLADAASARAEASKMDPPPALVLLAQRFGLSEFERDTLLLCAAVEFDPALASLYARAQGNPSLNFPTFALALTAFEEPRWDALAPHRPLRYARLLEINQQGAVALTSSPLRADETIVNFLKGLNVLDDRLSALVYPIEGSFADAVAKSQKQIVEGILQRWRQAAAQSVLPVAQLVGADPGSRLAVAAQVCATLNRRLYRLSTEALPAQVAELETLARLWQRESFLLPVALYIDAENAEGPSSESSTAIQRFLSREVGLVFVGVRDTPLRLACAHFVLDVPKPTGTEQREAWLATLAAESGGAESTEKAQALSGQFDLNLQEIQSAVTTAGEAPAKEGTLRERLWDACRDLTRPRLDLLAQRLDPKATWDDLVVPDEAADLLRQIASQVRARHQVYNDWGFSEKMNRGFGISALFAGDSGTGKTMGAEVIANDLRLNLYRIDLSAVVSKYIGETEKNLRKLFDAAEKGGAILFFDEADALFGKRSEVKDSHDRYANIEINYLLQRMEAFRGLAILATNMKNALDSAFKRRLRFIVNFQFPGVTERKLIWQKALPPKTPKSEFDYDRLARLCITGGNIHSIALNAAFMAAQDGQRVTMPIILAAARMEFRKLEKPFNETEFR
jgi:predicted nucleic acid-binding protein